MTFPHTVTEFWHEQLESGSVLHQQAGFRLTVNPDLRQDLPAQVLERTDGSAAAAVTPSIAKASGLLDDPRVDAAGFRERLTAGGNALQGVDLLFYISTADRPGVLDHAARSPARSLGPDDALVFSQFEASASPQDIDSAYVELDHWAVVGVFDGDRLVCAASAYPWQGSMMADIGVLTLEPARGKGYGRTAVQRLCAVAYDRGYEPQYRCQPDNRASAALALRAGFTRFGSWQGAAGGAG